MSLITRCPACTTMFKVVADQLKVAQGWVRCGHCGEVFDASLHLLPVEAGGLAGFVSAPEAPVPIEPPGSVQEAPAKEGDAGADLVEVEAVQPSLPPEARDILPDAQRSESPPADVPPDPPGRQDPVFTASACDVKLTDTEPRAFPAAGPEVPPSAEKAPEETPEVSFVNAARRNEFWKSPQVRAVLGLIFLLLLSALTLQWMVQQKDALAAQEPRIEPLLQALCRPLGCQIQPLRRIESLVIDSSSFSKTGANAYRLTFVFKNTGAAALEIPALEVTLTDSQDQALVRRVVMPAQFGATAVTLGAYSELAGAVSLKVSSEGAHGGTLPTPVGPLPVVGYRILAFYP